MKKRINQPDAYLPAYKIIETGSIEEMEYALNEADYYGYKIISLEHHRDDFFQSHTAVVSRKPAYLFWDKKKNWKANQK